MFFDDKKKIGMAILGAPPEAESEPDDQDGGGDFLKAIAEELIKAVHGADADHVASCLEALVAHIQAEDAKQDEHSY